MDFGNLEGIFFFTPTPKQMLNLWNKELVTVTRLWGHKKLSRAAWNFIFSIVRSDHFLLK